MSPEEIGLVLRKEQLLREKDQIEGSLRKPRDVYLEELGTQLSGNIDQAGIGITEGMAGLAVAANQLVENFVRGQTRFFPKAIRKPIMEQFEGATEVAERASEELKQLGEQTPGSSITRQVSSAVTQSAPSMAAAPLGLLSAVTVAGLQQYAGSFSENRRYYESKGATREEARAKALIPSLASGLTTAMVTAAFGRTGIESLSNGVATGTFRSVTRHLMHQAGLEGIEESVDEVGQMAIELMARDEGITMKQALGRAFMSFAAGTMAGGAILGANRIKIPRFRPEPGPIRTKIKDARDAAALIDGNEIMVKTARKQVMPGRDYVASPEFEFRNDTITKDLVVSAVEADLSWRFHNSEDIQRFEELATDLSTDEQKQVSRALFEFEGGNEQAIDQLPEKLQPAALEIRNYFDQIRKIVIAEKQRAIESSMNEEEMSALRALEGGMEPEQALSELDALQSETVRTAREDLEEARKWGIEKYVTHIERGHLILEAMVETEEGGLVSVKKAAARSRGEAARKAREMLDENPEIQSITISDEFAPGVEFPTQLTKGQYFRFINRAADELNRDADIIRHILTEANRVVAIKPTSKFAGPMQQRKDVFEGEENVFDILPVYSASMRKKLALDPVFQEARNNVIPQLDDTTRDQIESLLADIRGRKTLGDQIVDYLLSPQGRTGKIGRALDNTLSFLDFKPFGYSRAVNTARAVTTRLKLGYRPVAAAVNRVGGAMHTWAEFGTEYLVRGNRFIHTEEGQTILERNKPFIGIDAAFSIEGGRKAADSPWWAPMGMFQKMEQFNRPEAMGAAYLYGKEKLGLEGEALEKYARQQVRFTQFTYNIGSLPRLMRGPSGRLLFQFKPYLVKEIEFLSKVMKEPGSTGKMARYLTAQLAIGGPRAALYTLKSLPLLGALGWLDDLDDWISRNAPEVSRGIPGLMGFDVSPAVAFQFPERAEEWVGPFLGDVVRLWQDVLKPAMQGNNRDFSDLADWGSRLAPIVFWWGQAIEAHMSVNGWTEDQWGKLEFKPTTKEKIGMLMGAQPLRRSLQQTERFYLLQTEQIQREQRSRVIEQYLEALSEDDAHEAEELSKIMGQMGVTPEMLRRAAKERGMPPKLRLFRRLTRHRRAEEIERFLDMTGEEEGIEGEGREQLEGSTDRLQDREPATR